VQTVTRLSARKKLIDPARCGTLNVRDDVIMRRADFQFRSRVSAGRRCESELADSGSSGR